MAIRKIADLTTAAHKGLADFLEDEEGGTGKNAALSAGMLVGGTLMMHAIAAQVADAALQRCAYAQECPRMDFCFSSNLQWAGCGRPNWWGDCRDPDFC